MADVKKIAWEIFKISNPLAAVVAVALEAMSKSESMTDQGKLTAEADRQELMARMAQAAARTAQEVAIARRIEGAAEVEIEEYYEGHGEGSAGLKADEKSVTVGASGSGRRIVKRVYRFRGFDEPKREVQLQPTAPPQKAIKGAKKAKGKPKGKPKG